MPPVFLDLVLVLVAVALAIFAVPLMLTRGEWLKCPDCGEVFKAPAMDRRTVGFGYSPPYLGRVACPKDGKFRRRRRYVRVPRPAQP